MTIASVARVSLYAKPEVRRPHNAFIIQSRGKRERGSVVERNAHSSDLCFFFDCLLSGFLCLFRLLPRLAICLRLYVLLRSSSQ